MPAMMQPVFGDGRPSFRPNFHPEATVGRGLRSLLEGCPMLLIIASSKMLRDGADPADAFADFDQTAHESSSALMILRALDLAGQLPEGSERESALEYYGTRLHLIEKADVRGDRLLLTAKPRFADNTARNVGMTAYHFMSEDKLSLAARMLAVARMLGMEHERLDSAEERFATFGTDEGPAFAPRGTLNKHASPTWVRAMWDA